ncbi:13579_t:CDS:2 [Gigaspora rosea]|nr:13579_t:CDS:2 [Gigaspora rosea]
MSHKRSKKEWVIGQRKDNMRSFLRKDNLSSSSITPTNKILKMRENEIKDVSPWIKKKNEGGWVTAISLKHLKNMIAPEKKTRGKKESEVEHVTLAESWDVYLIQNLVKNRGKQRELTQALEKNQEEFQSYCTLFQFDGSWNIKNINNMNSIYEVVRIGWNIGDEVIDKD